MCLIPVSAHGTNPASAQMAGYQVQVVKVESNGNVSLTDLKKQVHSIEELCPCRQRWEGLVLKQGKTQTIHVAKFLEFRNRMSSLTRPWLKQMLL